MHNAYCTSDSAGDGLMMLKGQGKGSDERKMEPFGDFDIVGKNILMAANCELREFQSTYQAHHGTPRKLWDDCECKSGVR